MTPESLKLTAAAMLAHAEGREVQHRALSPVNTPIEWTDSTPYGGPTWLCTEYEYRPKPEPKVRPWSKPDDVPGPVCWLRLRAFLDHIYLVNSINPEGVYTGGASKAHPWKSLSEEAAEYSTDRKTWSACVVKEEA